MLARLSQKTGLLAVLVCMQGFDCQLCVLGTGASRQVPCERLTLSRYLNRASACCCALSGLCCLQAGTHPQLLVVFSRMWLAHGGQGVQMLPEEVQDSLAGC
jgi:hypothetical protein